MASAYSQDLRDRVIDVVIRGGMSRRAAAVRFGVSESSAIKWVQRFERAGSRAASKMGGYHRPKLEPHRRSRARHSLRPHKLVVPLADRSRAGVAKVVQVDPIRLASAQCRNRRDDCYRERDRPDLERNVC
jgi:transposase